MKLFLSLVLILTSFCDVFSQLVINEYSAANFDQNIDNYGDFEDWFEIYNTGANNIDLNGYYLSDKSDNLTKWQFNSPTVINANQRLTIFCSGRNEIIGTFIHTNFKLHQTKGNEWIILTNPDGVTVEDSILVRPCLTNQSRGRINDGDNNWGVFPNPSMNNTNNGAFTSYSQTPEFTPQEGIFANPTMVTITAAPGAQIFYTTDGSLPDNTDNLYTGPVNINSTTVLKAVSYDADPNILPSFMNYSTFFIGVNHTMKILSVSGRESNNPTDPEIFELIAGGVQVEPVGTFELYDENGILLDKARGEFNKHGNDSWAYAQRGFDYITRDQFGYNHAIQNEIFNGKERDKYQRLIIKAAANDNYPFSYGNSGAHIRDAYVQSLSQVAGLRLDERSFEPCVMYLNGQYWGVYELREKVDDLDFTDRYYDQDSVEFLKTWGGTWVDVLTTDQNQGPVLNSWNNFVNYVTTNDMTVQANYDYVKSLYNVGSLIDYFILNTYIVNTDWLNWNTAWWHGLKEDGDKKKWRYALWDMDNTFDHGANYTGVPNTGANADPCDPESLGDVGGQGHIPIWNALSQNQEFFDDYINRWSDMSNSYFSCDFMVQHLDSLIGLIEPEMQDQIDRWGGTMNEWQENVNYMKEFMIDRCEILNSSLVDCYDIEGPYQVNVQIVGVGEVQLNSIDIGNFNAPWNGEYFGSVEIDFSVTNGNYSNFQIISNEGYNYDPNDSDFSLELLGDITIIFYFDAIDITFMVNPLGAGFINLNGNNIANYPSTQSFNSGENINLSNTTNVGWVFNNWTSQNHTLSPNNNSQNVNFDVLVEDTITLNFVPMTHDITFVIDPNNADATVNINGDMISSFPYTTTVNYGEQITCQTQSSLNWEFTNFASNFHIPGISNSNYQTFTVQQNDSIFIYFEEIINYSISFDVQPPETGKISVNSLPVNIPYTQEFASEELVNFEALANYGWKFKNWTTLNGEVLPYASNLIGYTIARSSDTITANFEEIFEIFIPNSFSPNGDEVHDQFQVSVFSLHPFDFQISVFDRFGSKIFESTDFNDPWDGNHYKTKNKLPIGAYVYKLSIRSDESEKYYEKEGTITIIR
jgi:gliding motility-associated-like protein